MSKPRIREYMHAVAHPDRYSIYYVPFGGWEVWRGNESAIKSGESTPATLPEAMDAAYADAEARAALVPTC